MRYRTYPGTEIRVSEVWFGVWTVASPWWGIKDDVTACGLLRKAFDKGITFFDTADNYGNGKGETILRQALGDRLREITIGTKFGYDFYHHERKGQQELPQNFTPEYIRFSLEKSLDRLGTDHVDIYQLHNPRMTDIQRDDTFDTLRRLREEGKIRLFGTALGPAIHERQVDEGAQSIERQGCGSVQIIYNLLEQMLGPKIIAAARAAGAGILTRVPHSSGMLEGKFTKETTFDTGDHRSFRTREWLLEGLQKIERLKFLTDGTGRTLGQAALKFILAEPAMMSTLPNIYNEEQLEEFASAPDCPDLTAAELEQIARLAMENFGVAATGGETRFRDLETKTARG